MVQLSPSKGPTHMRSDLPGGTELTCIIASSMFHRGQPDCGESCNCARKQPDL